MNGRLLILGAAAALATSLAAAQGTQPALARAADALGAGTLTTIQFSGTGANFAFGQSVNPEAPWPRFNVTSYTRVIDYERAASRQEMVRTQGENPVRGGGGQPLIGEQRQVQLVSGTYAWNLAGSNTVPAPAALDERLLQIWVTPHGFLKAALANNATATAEKRSGRSVTVVSFTLQNRWKLSGIINDQNQLEQVDTWVDNPVLGDARIETAYSEYRDFGGVTFPSRIVQKQGGFPVMDLTITDVQPNAAAGIDVPQNLREAPAPAVRVESQQLAPGVWYLTGGSHHSVAVEFTDHIVMIEGPQNEERSLAVMAEVKKATPAKPIKYLVNTHHHFDHSGGIRTYAAEGATIITHQMNRTFYEKTFAAPRTFNPDRLARSGKKAAFETFTDRRILTDGARTLELLHIRGNTHNDGIIMAYLPKEKLLIEADVFTPGPPDAPPPATPNPFSVNLYDNLQRLKLDVAQIAPLHGRLVTMGDLLKAIGR